MEVSKKAWARIHDWIGSFWCSPGNGIVHESLFNPVSDVGWRYSSWANQHQFHRVPVIHEQCHGPWPVISTINLFLVGGLVAIFYVPMNIGFLIIPIDELIFFRTGWRKNHQTQMFRHHQLRRSWRPHTTAPRWGAPTQMGNENSPRWL